MTHEELNEALHELRRPLHYGSTYGVVALLVVLAVGPAGIEAGVVDLPPNADPDTEAHLLLADGALVVWGMRERRPASSFASFFSDLRPGHEMPQHEVLCCWWLYE